MKKTAFFILFTAIAVFTGCSESENDSESVASSVYETATETSSTTIISTETTTDPETTVTSSTVTTTETTSDITTTEKVFTHKVEIMNTEFGTRPVPEREYRRYEEDPDKVHGLARAAIEEGREMYGEPCTWCADDENGCIYVCVDFGIGNLKKYDYSFFRIDTSTDELSFCGNLEYENTTQGPVTDDLVLGVYGIYVVSGKTIVVTSIGLYLLDEDTRSLKTIERNFDVQRDNMYIAEDRFYYSIALTDEIKKAEYDPLTEKITYIDDIPEEPDAHSIGIIFSERFGSSKLTYDSENYGEQNVVFEW